MKTSHPARGHRGTPFRAALSASLALLGLCGGLATTAAQAGDRSDANASCRQETKRVAVWPKGPKSSRMARFEDREVTVCDGEVVSKRAKDAERDTNSSGD